MIKDRKLFAAAAAGVLLVLLTAGYLVNTMYMKAQTVKRAQSDLKLQENVQGTGAQESTNNKDQLPDEQEGAAVDVDKPQEARNANEEVQSTTAKSNEKVQNAPAKAPAKVTVASRSSGIVSKPVSNSTKSSTSSAKAEALDWWKEAQYIFPIGAVAKVTDVYTGKTFNIKRTFGTNHADCEALTLNDSQIIKSIWGGWSWARRPIVVQVNGKRIAASMAAMPHAGLDKYPAIQVVDNRSGGYGTGQNLDAVKGNGMDGHFDVHFLNSRTHGTNKVDPAHQAAIKQAVGK